MARRVVLGQVGSAFRFRVAQPGVDAATADLDEMIFDADAIPTRILATGTATVGPAANPTTPTILQQSHGVTPSLVIGVAQSIYTTPGQVDETNQWIVIQQLAASQGGGMGAFAIDPPGFKDGWAAPWYWFGTGQSGDSQSCGWRLGWDSSRVYLYNHSAVNIRTRWTALDF
jgi:hypothetical protein